MRVRARRTVELDVELARQLEELAREQGTSVNQTIQDLLREALDRKEQRPAAAEPNGGNWNTGRRRKGGR